MRLVYLYGPPGVGKLTIGTELAAQTGYKLFHNHLVVDLAVALFPRETPEYFDLLREVKTAGYVAAARADLSLVVTGVYRRTQAQDTAMRAMIAPVLELGGRPLFVQLSCERQEWLRRVQSEGRRSLNKITDPAFALSFMERFDLFARMPFEPHLTIDTTGTPPGDVARQIATHLE